MSLEPAIRYDEGIRQSQGCRVKGGRRVLVKVRPVAPNFSNAPGPLSPG